MRRRDGSRMDGLQVGCWKLEWGILALGAGAEGLLTSSSSWVGDKLDSYLSSSSCGAPQIWFLVSSFDPFGYGAFQAVGFERI